MKDVFIENLNNGSVESVCAEAGIDGKIGLQSNGRPYAYYLAIGTLKTEYSVLRGCFRVGYNKRHSPEIIDLFFDELTQFYDGDPVATVVKTKAGASSDGTPGAVVDVIGLHEPEDFVTFCNEVERIVSDSDSIGTRSRTASAKGVSFEGTFFSDLKERGATMGGMFGKMVCDASSMFSRK